MSALPAVATLGLRHRFGDFAAVDGVDLTVRQGEVFGLLGPNGAGKTTLIRLVNTLLPLQEGTVHVLGHDVQRAQMAVRRSLGYVPQQLSVEAALTGRENVAWFARLFDVPRRERKQRVEEMRKETGMTVLLTTHYMEEAEALCDRVALMHLGSIRATGTPDELCRELGPGATLEDVFRRHTGNTLDGAELGKGGLREVRRTRRTAGRVG